MSDIDHQESNWFVEAVSSAIESVYDSGRTLTTCETPGHTFGLHIGFDGVYITECGCHTEAVWPIALTLGAAGVKTLGAEAIDQIIKHTRRRLARKLVNNQAYDLLTVRLSESMINYIQRHNITLNKLSRFRAPGFETNVRPLFDNVLSKLRAFSNSLDEIRDNAELLFTSKAFRDKHFYIALDGLAAKANEIRILKEELVAYIKEYKNTFLRDPSQSRTAQKLIDNFEVFVRDINELYQIAENNAIPETVNTLDYGLGFLSFAAGILGYITVVVDKECSPLLIDENFKSEYYGPWDPNFPSDLRNRVIQAIDAVYFGGKWQGSSWDGSIFYPTFRNDNDCKADPSISEALGNQPSWQQIREVLIDKQMPVWPEMNATCECSECPSGYKLCSYSSIVNGWSDIYNICLPVCGGQDINPVNLGGVVTKANCEIGCPEGYVWVNCNSSDCDKSPCKDGSDKGFCVAIPETNKFPVFSDGRTGTITVDPKYGKQVWDPVTCRWVCKNFVEVQEIVDSNGNISIITPNNWEPKYTGGLNNRLLNPFTPNKVIFYSECPDNSIRVPEADCECQEVTSSGSYDIGVPEVPDGYILFDGTLIPIED